MKKLKPTDLKGFVAGVHQPYTDYNQDIIDWLEEHSDETEFDEQYRKYIFGGKLSFYTHDVTYKHEVYYTNEQFMELIGMQDISNNFPVLGAGKHLVRIGEKNGVMCFLVIKLSG